MRNLLQYNECHCTSETFVGADTTHESFIVIGWIIMEHNYTGPTCKQTYIISIWDKSG